MTRPKPRDEPVTQATCPANGLSFILYPFGVGVSEPQYESAEREGQRKSPRQEGDYHREAYRDIAACLRTTAQQAYERVFEAEAVRA